MSCDTFRDLRRDPVPPVRRNHVPGEPVAYVGPTLKDSMFQIRNPNVVVVPPGAATEKSEGFDKLFLPGPGERKFTRIDERSVDRGALRGRTVQSMKLKEKVLSFLLAHPGACKVSAVAAACKCSMTFVRVHFRHHEDIFYIPGGGRRKSYIWHRKHDATARGSLDPLDLERFLKMHPSLKFAERPSEPFSEER